MITIKYYSSMVVILWGLIFSKCLTLEYLVQVYSVPINSFFYIWLLTLTMASFATIVFFRTKTTQSWPPEKLSLVQIIWLGCGIASLLPVGIFFLTGKLEARALVTTISIIAGIGYLFHGISTGKSIHTFSGIGWWIGAAVLVTQSDPENLALLAFLIILLTILPLIIEIRRQKTGFF